MPRNRSGSGNGESADRQFLTGLARGFGSAMIFSLPMLMTMEMWWLGFYVDRIRLVVLFIFMLPLLVALDYFSGLRETSSWREDVVDGIGAYGLGMAASILVLFLFNVIDLETPLREMIGKVSIQAIPAAFGAVLSASQLSGSNETDENRREAGYPGDLLFMAAGAVFLAFNVAPTEEMLLIAVKMTSWHVAVLLVTSLLLSHAFVYAMEFRGSPPRPEGVPGWSLFLRYSLVSYAVSLVISAYVLWTFGHFDDGSVSAAVEMCVVLGFPASLGAAAARVIL